MVDAYLGVLDIVLYGFDPANQGFAVFQIEIHSCSVFYRIGPVGLVVLIYVVGYRSSFHQMEPEYLMGNAIEFSAFLFCLKERIAKAHHVLHKSVQDSVDLFAAGLGLKSTKLSRCSSSLDIVRHSVYIRFSEGAHKRGFQETPVRCVNIRVTGMHLIAYYEMCRLKIGTQQQFQIGEFQIEFLCDEFLCQGTFV